MQTESPQLLIPPAKEIERRIELLRDELAALTRLLRMARAAQLAADARSERATVQRAE